LNINKQKFDSEVEMNYHKIYNSIVCKAKEIEIYRISEKKRGEYFENHHILPRSLGGLDIKDNLVLLTAKEHFICHFLLAKHYIKFGNIAEQKKMIAAFTQMCRDSNGSRIRSRSYQYARKMWSDHMKQNHWAFDNDWKIAQSERMKQYYAENPMFRKKYEIEEKQCACGCGNTFMKRTGKSQKYIHGHNVRNNSSIKEKQSKSMKDYISRLSQDEKKKRIKASFGSCDHEKRGKKISESKKGKSSNQKEKVGKQLALLTDDEFQNYLIEKNYSAIIVKRFTTYRNEYLRND